MPHTSKWFTFWLYTCAFWGAFGYFIWQQYHQGRTSSFITLDNTSGVCLGDPKSKTCCEVPQSITGTFLADAFGKWDTQNGFSYIQNNYAVTVAGLEYTNEQWTAVMKNITSQLKTIGMKGANRDYAWNLVALSSFTAQNLDQGFLQFYATGETGIIYDKQILQVGFASAQSDNKECDLPITTSYTAESSTLTINTQLCEHGPCVGNPCPNITAPGGMGYDYTQTSLNTMTIKVNMEAVTTALAVNMGMTPLNHLVEVPGDNDRHTLLSNMVSAGYITQTQADHTSSYYDNLYAPTHVVYCWSENLPTHDLTHTWLSGKAFCFVRIGNLLTYPVTSSYGWSNSGISFPSKCTSTSVLDSSASKYYCNLMDVTFSLIYYPVNNLNPNATDSYTYRPTKAPTNRPTPLPGKPTTLPTFLPTFRPSKIPSNRPTPLPGSPTWKPTYSTTAKPTTFRPTPLPGKPTRLPTFKPTAKPSVSAAPSTSFHPSVSAKPTRQPSVSPKPTVSFRPTTSTRPTRVPTSARRLEASTQMSPEEAQLANAANKAEYFNKKHFLAPGAPSEIPTEAPSNAPAATDAPSEAPVYYYSGGGGGSTGGGGGSSTGGGGSTNFDDTDDNFGGTTGVAYGYHPVDSGSSVVYSSGSGSSASAVYSNNAGDDDFTPLLPVVIDNGKIFAFAAYAAAQFDIVNNSVADIFVSNIAFDAVSDTLFGTDVPDMNGKYHSYADDFAKLCSPDVNLNISSGCAMLAFEVYGGQDRSISDYYYQPSATPAFTNTLFVPSELASLQKNTPTSLIQTYYTCVLAPWPAFFAALGLAAGNVAVWVPLAFAIYMIISVQWLNYFHSASIPPKKRKERDEAREAEARDREINLMLAQFSALRGDVADGRLSAPRLQEAIDKGDELIAPEADDAGKEQTGVEMYLATPTQEKIQEV